MAFYHDSAKESKDNGLLIDQYWSDKKSVDIGNQKYKIIESWTSYKFKARNSKEIYKEIISFTIILEDSSKNRKPDFRLTNLMKCKNKDLLFNNVGISDSQYRVFFDKKSKENIDTIAFEFRDYSNNATLINFIKHNK
ncbi:MAG: hypothetical protein M0D53_16835 [Flavobacterium sp. JAD_PAG50586_2]|nr:MAG: hypothetical protein M0D53_16835 [Flavobacterium sp. JAD_PAG50586_2]